MTFCMSDHRIFFMIASLTFQRRCRYDSASIPTFNRTISESTFRVIRSNGVFNEIC